MASWRKCWARWKEARTLTREATWCQRQEWRRDFQSLRVPRVKAALDKAGGGWSEEKVQEAYDWVDEQTNRYARRAHRTALAALAVAVVWPLLLLILKAPC